MPFFGTKDPIRFLYGSDPFCFLTHSPIAPINRNTLSF
jgi:hypothetical protein